MTFNTLEFQNQIKKDNPSYREGASSMGAISRLVSSDAGVAQLKQALREMPPHKIERYEHSLRYLVDFYPGFIETSQLIQEDAKVMKGGHPVSFQLSVGPEHQLHGDLLYGISPARTLEIYKLPTSGKMTICDNYNNAAEIGTGLAFGRTWDGTGFLDTTPGDVAKVVNRKAANPDGPCSEHGLKSSRFASYARGLMNSRYNPADTLTLPNSRVQKDTQHSIQDMQENRAIQNKKEVKLHHMAHAHFFKAVRRACKGGIAMAASSPEFTASGARVHFLLDGMGDLGKAARKEAFKNCTPITSSELGFCFRYWSKLKDIVHFYLNGVEVKAPWEANWNTPDANGQIVNSGKDAWLRYEFYRSITGRDQKEFPTAWCVHSTDS